EFGDPRLVQLQALLLLRRTQAQRQVELAAADARGDAFAQHRLQRAQVLVHPHPRLQEAVVDRAQLAGKRAPGGLALATGVGGHASDHAWLPGRRRAPDGKLARPSPVLVACQQWFPTASPVPVVAPRTSCARSASSATSPAMPKARCWSVSATPRCCAPPVSRTASAAGCAARARAGSPPSTACSRVPR